MPKGGEDVHIVNNVYVGLHGRARRVRLYREASLGISLSGSPTSPEHRFQPESSDLRVLPLFGFENEHMRNVQQLLQLPREHRVAAPRSGYTHFEITRCRKALDIAPRHCLQLTFDDGMLPGRNAGAPL